MGLFLHLFQVGTRAPLHWLFPAWGTWVFIAEDSQFLHHVWHFNVLLIPAVGTHCSRGIPLLGDHCDGWGAPSWHPGAARIIWEVIVIPFWESECFLDDWQWQVRGNLAWVLWPSSRRGLMGNKCVMAPDKLLLQFLFCFKAALSTSWNIGLEYRRE